MGRLLTFNDLNELKGISYCRSQLWKLERAGKFPRRVRLGVNSIRWDEDEIDTHLQGKKAARPVRPLAPRPFRRVKQRA